MGGRPEVCADLSLHAGVAYLPQLVMGGLPEAIQVRRLVLRLKDGDPAATQILAGHLASHPGLHDFRGTVIPAPRSTPDRPTLLDFAEALVTAGVGRRVLPCVVRVAPIRSSREIRQHGGRLPTVEEHVRTLRLACALPWGPILLLDDVVTSGVTLCATAAVLRATYPRRRILGAAAAWAPYLAGTIQQRRRAAQGVAVWSHVTFL